MLMLLNLRAALVVFLITLPLSVGVAIASGFPASSGMISAVIAALISFLFSKSTRLINLPAMGVVVASIFCISFLGSIELFLVSIFLAGVLQVILAYLPLDKLMKLFPKCIIVGVLGAIGLALIVRQIPYLTGNEEVYVGLWSLLDIHGANSFVKVFADITTQYNVGALILSLISFMSLYIFAKPAFMLKGRDYSYFLSAASIVIVLVTIINLLFIHFIPDIALTGDKLIRTTNIHNFHYRFFFPDTLDSTLLDYRVYLCAIIIALVSSFEAMTMIKLINLRVNEKVDIQHELKVQGVSNMCLSFFGGVPISTSLVGTMLNCQHGASTRYAILYYLLMIVVTFMGLSYFVNYIPLVAIAVVMIALGFSFIRFDKIKAIYRQGMGHFMPCVLTFAVGFLINLFIGMIMGLLMFYAIRFLKKEKKCSPL